MMSHISHAYEVDDERRIQDVYENGVKDGYETGGARFDTDWFHMSFSERQEYERGLDDGIRKRWADEDDY